MKYLITLFLLFHFTTKSFSQFKNDSGKHSYNYMKEHDIQMSNNSLNGLKIEQDSNGVYFVPDPKSYDSNAIIHQDARHIYFPLNIANSPYNNKPLNHPYYDKEGSYSLVVNMEHQEILPGETIIFQVYTTGYGIIERSKIFFLPSTKDYDTLLSKSFNDVSFDKDYTLHYGIDSYPILQAHNKIFSIGGGFLTNSEGEAWNKPTSYFDIHPLDNINGTISSEEYNDKAPFEVHLKTLDSIKPGTYFVHFVLTYFDGIKWRNDEKIEIFHVNNPLEANPVGYWQIALIIGIIVGLPAWIELLRKVEFFKKKKQVVTERNKSDEKPPTLPLNLNQNKSVPKNTSQTKKGKKRNN